MVGVRKTEIPHSIKDPISSLEGGGGGGGSGFRTISRSNVSC